MIQYATTVGKNTNAIESSSEEKKQRYVRYALWNDAVSYAGRTLHDKKSTLKSFEKRQSSRKAGTVQYSEAVSVRDAVRWAK